MSFILTCNEIALKQSDSFKICEAELEPSSFQAYYFSQLRQAPSEYCGWCPVNLRFCSLFIGTGTMPGPLWALGTFLLWLFQVVLPHYRVVSSDAYDDKYFDEYLRGTLWRSPEFSICAAFFSPLFCPVSSSCLDLTGLSAPSPY